MEEARHASFKAVSFAWIAGAANEKRPAISRKPYILEVVRPKRFELLTYRFVACCSIQLSYERPTAVNLGKSGANVKHFF